MRILVYPHAMDIGGSQLNAIELAAGVRDRGHDVFVAGRPGPLVDYVDQLGLEFTPLTSARGPFSMRLLRSLTQLVDELRIDVVHGYEWPPAMSLFFGPHLMRGVPAVCTVMSMAVAPFLPKSLPLIVGTEDLRHRALLGGRTGVTLIEPPVDTDANAPDFDGIGFREEHGLDPEKVLVVVVGRLSNQLKLEGLLSACDALGQMASDGVPVQMAIVGDGEASQTVAERANKANALAGHRVVVLTGSKRDPRPAYAAADILLGMGGSALRGMAFGKPLVVQGELGFWRLCSPETVGEFLENGWYGLGGIAPPVDERGLALGAERLRLELESLLANAARRRALGDFGRKLVVERFSLSRAAMLQEQVYTAALNNRSKLDVWDTLSSGALALAHSSKRRVQRRLGLGTAEDFNAVAVLAKARISSTQVPKLP